MRQKITIVKGYGLLIAFNSSLLAPAKSQLCLIYISVKLFNINGYFHFVVPFVQAAPYRDYALLVKGSIS